MRPRLATVRLQGISTLTTNIAKGDAHTEALRERCEYLLRANRLPELAQLMNEHPELAPHDWARTAIVRLQGLAYQHPRRGRRRGSFWVHPLWIIGLVQELRRANPARSLNDAFCELARLGIAASPDSAKQAYHAGLRDKRFEPLLVRIGPEFPICAEEYQARFGRSEMLAPGQTATRTIRDPLGGEGTITFKSEN